MVPFATLPLVDKFRFRSQIWPLPWLLSIWTQKSPAAKSSSSASWCSCSAILPPSLMVKTRKGSPASSGPSADPSPWYSSPFKAFFGCARIVLRRKNSSKAIVSGSIFAWRWGFQTQAVNMRHQCSFRGPATEVEAQHLLRPLGRGASDPQADHQTRHKGCLDLAAHPVEPLAPPMPAAQDTFDPAEKQRHRPPR